MSIQELYNVATLPLRLLKEITFDVYVLSDKEKKIIYITSTSVGITQHIIEKLCSKDVTITKIKRVYIWELRKFVDKQDAVLVDMYKSFANSFKDGFLVPSLVGQVLDIDRPINEAIKLSNSELKKVHKYKCEISNDPEALKFFYEKIYVQYAKTRYGKFAHIENFSYLEKIFRNGELVFVTLNDDRVCAYLCGIDGEKYICSKNGALDESFVREGAMVAAYYFSILRAKEIGAKIVHFGGSKPFLSDGVLRHKNKWGTKICETGVSKRFVYLKNVLFEQPFIYIDDNKFKIAVFSEDDKFIKEYANSGIEFNIFGRKNAYENKNDC
jgi:hypothetical protein